MNFDEEPIEPRPKKKRRTTFSSDGLNGFCEKIKMSFALEKLAADFIRLIGNFYWKDEGVMFWYLEMIAEDAL